MKTIIAGSRTIRSLYHVLKAVIDSDFEITEVVSGHADGVDRAGEAFASANGLPVKLFEPDWQKYGRSAGPIRNREMAEYADALILVWDGRSRGSKNMLEEAKKHNLKIFERIING